MLPVFEVDVRPVTGAGLSRVRADDKKWNAGRNMRKSSKKIAKYFWSGVHFCQRAGLNRVWLVHQKARSLELKDKRILNAKSMSFSEVDACLAPRTRLDRVRQARQRARPLEENSAKILKENLSPFSEEDACSALGAGLNRVWQKS